MVAAHSPLSKVGLDCNTYTPTLHGIKKWDHVAGIGIAVETGLAFWFKGRGSKPAACTNGFAPNLWRHCSTHRWYALWNNMRHDLFACFENKPKVQKGHQLNFAKTTKDKPKETRKKDRDKKNTNIFNSFLLLADNDFLTCDALPWFTLKNIEQLQIIYCKR